MRLDCKHQITFPLCDEQHVQSLDNHTTTSPKFKLLKAQLDKLEQQHVVRVNTALVSAYLCMRLHVLRTAVNHSLVISYRGFNLL